MTSFTNQSKNSTSITNQSKTVAGDSLTWNEATMTSDVADFAWDETGTTYSNQVKNTTTLTNQTKH